MKMHEAIEQDLQILHVPLTYMGPTFSIDIVDRKELAKSTCKMLEKCVITVQQRS